MDMETYLHLVKTEIFLVNPLYIAYHMYSYTILCSTTLCTALVKHIFQNTQKYLSRLELKGVYKSHKLYKPEGTANLTANWPSDSTNQDIL